MAAVRRLERGEVEIAQDIVEQLAIDLILTPNDRPMCRGAGRAAAALQLLVAGLELAP
jgi:hypothetical protein